jgi:hypothetical protein
MLLRGFPVRAGLGTAVVRAGRFQPVFDGVFLMGGMNGNRIGTGGAAPREP